MRANEIETYRNYSLMSRREEASSRPCLIGSKETFRTPLRPSLFLLLSLVLHLSFATRKCLPWDEFSENYASAQSRCDRNQRLSQMYTTPIRV